MGALAIAWIPAHVFSFLRRTWMPARSPSQRRIRRSPSLSRSSLWWVLADIHVRLRNGHKSATFCGRGCQQETHHSEERGEGYLRVQHCDGSLAGIHVRLRNGHKSATFCGCGCQQETHHGEERGEGYLRVQHCDGSLAGIHIRLENYYPWFILYLQHCAWARWKVPRVFIRATVHVVRPQVLCIPLMFDTVLRMHVWL